MAVGFTVVLVTGLMMVVGGSSGDDGKSGQAALSDSQGFEPYDTGLFDEPPSAPPDGADGVEKLGGAAAANPFANSAGDRKLHKVVITFRSDGALYAGWRYRSKGGSGLKVAERSLTVSQTVRGPLPVAQAAVQVLQTSTYATCVISVDGVAVTSQTARGVNHVIVCLG